MYHKYLPVRVLISEQKRCSESSSRKPLYTITNTARITYRRISSVKLGSRIMLRVKIQLTGVVK